MVDFASHVWLPEAKLMGKPATRPRSRAGSAAPPETLIRECWAPGVSSSHIFPMSWVDLGWVHLVMGVSIVMGVPPVRWMVYFMENTWTYINGWKLGVPLFQETTKYRNTSNGQFMKIPHSQIHDLMWKSNQWKSTIDGGFCILFDYSRVVLDLLQWALYVYICNI